jgi:hypothetical protein
LIRRLVRQYLGQPPGAKVPDRNFSRLIGLGASGKADVGGQHDRALAGALAREHLR